jgi:hypothetical protein
LPPIGLQMRVSGVAHPPQLSTTDGAALHFFFALNPISIAS